MFGFSDSQIFLLIISLCFCGFLILIVLKKYLESKDLEKKWEAERREREKEYSELKEI